MKVSKGFRLVEKSYLVFVTTSEFGATTDIRPTPDHGHVIGPVLLSSATMRHSLDFGEGLKCRNYGRSRHAICTTEFGQKATFPVFL